jgi:hypothetical protein
MQTAAQMLDFVRGKGKARFAASPVFTSVMTQAIHGHPWLTTSNEPRTIEDILAVGRQCGFIPFFEVLWFEVGVIDYDDVRDEIRGDVCDRVKTFRTPKGEFALVDRFTRLQSRSVARHAFSTLDDLDAYEYVIRRSIDRIEQCRPKLREVIRRAGDRGLPYFTANSPLKCFNLIGSAERILLVMDAPDRMMQLCRLNEDLSVAATKIAFEEGFRVFFAGTESSLYSPDMVEKYVIDFLVERRRAVRDLGALFYLHECGKMQDLIDKGYYRRLGPDILEGFQPPPSGDITDLGAAARGLPKSIVTKGNLDLNFLLNARPDEVRDAAVTAMAGIKGRRHIMGGSCSALPGTPLANLSAMVEAVDLMNKKAPK